MKVLVTGVNGFIGRHTAKVLRADGIHVTGTDRQVNCHCADIPYVRGNLTDRGNLASLIQAGPYDCIVHLAASIEDDPLGVNALSTYHMLLVAGQTHCRCFIHLSSIPIIGCPPDGPITEAAAASPRTAYHVSKYAAEQVVMLPEFAAMRRYNLRIASPVGPDMPMRFPRVMLERAKAGGKLELYGTGSRVQNYIDARDIGASLLKVMHIKPEPGLYLLGGESHSNAEVARLSILAANDGQTVFAGRPDPLDQECWIVDDRKARMAFGHAPQYSLEQTLRDMLI